ncbi:MAG: hypothetical protein J2O49_05525 [Sciscionella sp.]|nr:hypothetical protein [Sciscionella sp.]
MRRLSSIIAIAATAGTIIAGLSALPATASTASTSTASLSTAAASVATARKPHTAGTVTVFDHIPQFGIYRSTDPSYTPPAGVLMWNHGTEYARQLSTDEKAKIGSDVALRLTYHAQCDNYDRFGNVFYIAMPHGQTPTASTPRVTLEDFITPFSDYWQGNLATRQYPDASMSGFANALADPNRDVWVGISGGSNPYSGDPCDGKGLPTSFTDVGFSYSLALVSTKPLVSADPDVDAILSRYGLTTNTYTSPAVPNTAEHGTGKLAVSIAGYGADSGGEEYTNTTITVNVNGAKLTSFSDAVDCAQYAVYSPDGNPGIFVGNTTYNPRSWCPGAAIPTRFFDLGDIANKTTTVNLAIDRPTPFTAESQYRTSLAILEQ